MPPFNPSQMANPALRARALELADKALMTAAEGALLALGVQHEHVVALDFFAVDWAQVGGYALGGAALSLLLNLGRGGITGRGKGKG